MVKAIHTKNAPEALGPYSQGIQAGDFVYVSGQIGINPETGELVEGIKKQTEQVMKNLQAILAEANAEVSQAVKFTIYLSSMNDFATVNDIYGSYLTEPYPARATIEVSKLPKDALVEIEAVVYTK
jgi:2-iminobutanoate/2-iminopropanoate deaminase